jgi:hypothetical protein
MLFKKKYLFELVQVLIYGDSDEIVNPAPKTYSRFENTPTSKNYKWKQHNKGSISTFL